MRKEIETKIESLRREFPLLSKQSADYIFNALVVQTLFFKNPANTLEQGNWQKIIVDGQKDGGIDCILNDLDSDDSDMVFIQCKYKESLPLEEIKAALDKMYGAYLNLINAKYSY